MTLHTHAYTSPRIDIYVDCEDKSVGMCARVFCRWPAVFVPSRHESEHRGTHGRVVRFVINFPLERLVKRDAIYR